MEFDICPSVGVFPHISPYLLTYSVVNASWFLFLDDCYDIILSFLKHSTKVRFYFEKMLKEQNILELYPFGAQWCLYVAENAQEMSSQAV